MPKKHKNKNILKQIRDLDNEELKYYACAGYAYAKQRELEEEEKINEKFDCSLGLENRTTVEFDEILNLIYISKHNEELAEKYRELAKEDTLEESKINLAEIAEEYGNVAETYRNLAREVANKGLADAQVRE